MRAELDALKTDARPRLSWRVGISGHIKLPDANRDDLQKALARILEAVDGALNELQKDPSCGIVFAPAKPHITVLSPLAEGSDRIVAEVALKKGMSIASPLPLKIEDYKADFKHDGKDTAPDFDRLLQYARGTGGVVELEGKGDPPKIRDMSYLAVGEFVLRHCDMLIAIWNAEDEAGVGGTGQIVREAHEFGLPVVHVHSKPPHAITIREGAAESARRPFSEAVLSALISRQILPEPRPSDPHARSFGEWLRGLARRLGGPNAHEMHGKGLRERERRRQLDPAKVYFFDDRLRHTGKEPDFLYEGPFEPAMPWHLRTLAKIFPGFVWLLGKKVIVEDAEQRPPPSGPDEPTVRYLFLQFQRADVLATFYANLHRSAFMLVYGLSALALALAVLAMYAADESHHLTTLLIAIELSTLFTLAAIVFADNDGRWRDRFLEYRLLAELLREADLLAQIGRPMPFNRIDDLAEDLPGRAWVMIIFRAIVRSTALVSVKHDESFLTRVRDYAAKTRLQDQIAYHSRAKSRNESIGRKLQVLGYVTFTLTIVVGATKLLLPELAHDYHLAPWAGILPALAYAAFGIRNQAEFEIVSKRSERMIAKLTRHKERIAVMTGHCLTGEALGREIVKAAAVMRHDAADWTSIFEVKETETA